MGAGSIRRPIYAAKTQMYPGLKEHGTRRMLGGIQRPWIETSCRDQTKLFAYSNEALTRRLLAALLTSSWISIRLSSAVSHYWEIQLKATCNAWSRMSVQDSEERLEQIRTDLWLLYLQKRVPPAEKKTLRLLANSRIRHFFIKMVFKMFKKVLSLLPVFLDEHQEGCKKIYSRKLSCNWQ